MGFSEFAYVPTLKNISDLFTKAADSGTIRRLVPALKGQDLRLIEELTQTYDLQGRKTSNVRLQQSNAIVGELTWESQMNEYIWYDLQLGKLVWPRFMLCCMCYTLEAWMDHQLGRVSCNTSGIRADCHTTIKYILDPSEGICRLQSWEEEEADAWPHCQDEASARRRSLGGESRRSEVMQRHLFLERFWSLMNSLQLYWR